MKKFLLAILALVTLSSVFAQQPCPVDAKRNNGNGQCPTNQTNVNLVASITVTLSYPTNVIPILFGIIVNGSLQQVDNAVGQFTNAAHTEVSYCVYSGTGSELNIPSKFDVILQYPGQSGPCTANIPTPVKMKSLTASRNKSNVSLTWTTASESSNKGFNVQRNTKGTWETIAFVFSKTTDGNSSSDINYSFNDVNANKNVTQYRLQQVDINGRAEYSEIRSVRGEEMSSRMLVFPNPSNTGNVSLVFEDASAKNVQLMDLNGRLVRQLKNVVNSASFGGLETGVYSIRVSDVATNAVTVEKVVIRK